MATRTIVTSQPDVACYVCERRLLRGEQPEVFLAAGRPRTVCELCAPRAAHAGWPREVEGDEVSVSPLRARRGRGLFDRLRNVGRGTEASPRAGASSSSRDRDPDSYDFLDRASAVDAATPAEAGEARLTEPRSEDDPPPTGRSVSQGSEDGFTVAEPDPWAVSVPELLDGAIEVFNAGEYPRRVSGLARSLGVPEVSVQPVEGVPNVVEIVVAWELCWYRYRVDLDEDRAEAHARAQGTDLSELAREDRLANAAVNELGMVSLLSVAGTRV
jgi:hypothetical protein